MNQNKSDKTRNTNTEFSLTYGLRGRQSVRATFKLTSESIEAISIVAAQLGIKQKSLFDHLVEDLDALTDMARKLNETKMDEQADRVQKTYVLSRRSLLSLESAANSYQASRDVLVELLVQRLLPIIVKERQKHLQRKALLKKLAVHYRSTQELADLLEKELEKDDPMATQFSAALSSLNSAMANISAIVERGRPLEEFDLDEFAAE
jgi:hypothetical protein